MIWKWRIARSKTVWVFLLSILLEYVSRSVDQLIDLIQNIFGGVDNFFRAGSTFFLRLWLAGKLAIAQCKLFRENLDIVSGGNYEMITSWKVGLLQHLPYPRQSPPI